jgi:NAD(P)-dependent dehydrogenase (short-subunit alcohol dehydrogenase family)
LLINASGLLHAPGIEPEKLLEHVDAAALRQLFEVNAHGPILLARALLPWLVRKRRIIYASLSARVGSIDDNRLGGWYGYRASKAAQNQLLKTLAIELRRRNPEAIVLVLHPGTTDTHLSRPFQRNVAPGKLFSPDFVASRLMAIIEAAESDNSGRFIAWDGEEIPW